MFILRKIREELILNEVCKIFLSKVIYLFRFFFYAENDFLNIVFRKKLIVLFSIFI